MSTQHHLYNGLARPTDYSIFAREWTRPPVVSSLKNKETYNTFSSKLIVWTNSQYCRIV